MHATVKVKIVIPKKPPAMSACGECGADSGHWPSCSKFK